MSFSTPVILVCLQFLLTSKLKREFWERENCSLYTQNTYRNWTETVAQKRRYGPYCYLYRCTPSDHIQTFWKGVHSVIQKVIGQQLPLTPSLCLLNYTAGNLLDTDTESLLMILLFLAKKCMLSTPQVQTVDMWISQISALIPLEKLDSVSLLTVSVGNNGVTNGIIIFSNE